VRNWPEYEAGLKKRGDLKVWLSDDALNAWRVPAEGKPGGQRTYSDVPIEAALTIRMGEGGIRPRDEAMQQRHSVHLDATASPQKRRSCYPPNSPPSHRRMARNNNGIRAIELS
jgi:Transposase DDE domain